MVLAYLKPVWWLTSINEVTNARQALYLQQQYNILQNLNAMQQTVHIILQPKMYETLQQKYPNLFKVSFASYKR